MIEEWKEINGFEGKYWISNLGRVRGIKSTLKLKPKDTGYTQCTPSENNRNPVTTHRKRVVNMGSNNPMYGKPSSMRGVTKSNHFNSKKVIRCSISGDSLEEYGSLIEAGEAVNASPSTISNCIAGRLKSCKGYLWRWKM